ncbi:DUF3006 domain-containing protein [Nitrososphaera sp.]|uniref:DUF3006 domain-containing protein n=1 Tax=Nitrososphaera sp. TaxID=1971748 RepID=UPI002EDACB29
MEIIKASLDRFEGDFAVVYSDDDSRKFDVPKAMVSELKAGSRILVYFENESVVKVVLDTRETNEARKRIMKKYRSLKNGQHLDSGHDPKI